MIHVMKPCTLQLIARQAEGNREAPTVCTTDDRLGALCCGESPMSKPVPRVKHVCAACEKTVWLSQSHPKVKHHFCDSHCYGNWLSINNRGGRNPSWRGGRRQSAAGYVYLSFSALSAEDQELARPMAHYQGGSRTLEVPEHRLVMARKMGRPLICCKGGDCEIVHHINGDRSDNRAGNLEMRTAGEHTAMHFATNRTERETQLRSARKSSRTR